MVNNVHINCDQCCTCILFRSLCLPGCSKHACFISVVVTAKYPAELEQPFSSTFLSRFICLSTDVCPQFFCLTGGKTARPISMNLHVGSSEAHEKIGREPFVAKQRAKVPEWYYVPNAKAGRVVARRS